MTAEKVLENLKELIGTEMDYDDVICAFEDFGENGEYDVLVEKSDNPGYDYIAFIDTPKGTGFYFSVDKNDIITDVWTLWS